MLNARGLEICIIISFSFSKVKRGEEALLIARNHIRMSRNVVIGSVSRLYIVEKPV